MKRFRKIYVEISNICNLKCAFCPGTARSKRAMTEEEFASLLPKLQPWTDYLYFHLMGEPLCHPKLYRFIELAAKHGFKVILTTNGTLLGKHLKQLSAAEGLHKVNISLHAFEANDLTIPFETYLDNCFAFGKAAEGKILISYRLWNNGGANAKNDAITERLKAFFPEPWVSERGGIRIGQRVYLEHGDKFDWPDLNAQVCSNKVFCYGMRDHIGILCDGTVVPCCLDHDGDIPLGNLLDEDLGTILDTPRAKAIYEGFTTGNAPEALCRRCGYATRFQK
ncbi:MAG: radical SAM protein [Ruminococcaceae bacterium]|nr:radical SAM protein [Oscillospiraceae bacterium]